MPDYRLYFFDDSGRRILSVRETNANDDGQAIADSGEFFKQQPMELWCQPTDRFRPLADSAHSTIGGHYRGG